MACDHVTSCNFHRKTKLAENWPNWLREKCYSIDDAKSLVRRDILQIIQLSAKVAVAVFMYVSVKIFWVCFDLKFLCKFSFCIEIRTIFMYFVAKIITKLHCTI